MTDDLTKASGAELLALLARRFASHPDDPWAPLRNGKGELPKFPTWDVPVADFLADHELDIEDIIVGPRQELAGGWTYALLAHRGDAYFEITEGPEREGPIPLDEVLDRYFNDPTGDVREALDVGEICLSPDDGADFRFEGIRIYEPGSDGVSEWFEVTDERPPFRDAEAIGELTPQPGSLFTRRPAGDEVVRPLFVCSPDIEGQWDGNGRLTCDWRTEYYVPKELYTSTDSVWTYTRHELSQCTVLEGPSTADLADEAWRYKRMRDLAKPLAAVLAQKARRQFFAPVYEAVLRENRG